MGSAPAVTLLLELASLKAGLTPIFGLLPPSEDRVLLLGEAAEDVLCTLEIHMAVLGHISTHHREVVFPDGHESLDAVLPDFESRQVRQEVVSDEEAHEDPVVDGALKIPLEGEIGNVQLNGKVLTEDRHMEPDEGLQGMGIVLLAKVAALLFCLTSAVSLFVALLAAESAHPGLAILEEHILTKNAEVRLVGGKTKHDEIGVQPVDDVPGVGVMLGRVALRAHEVHDLVLTLAGNGGIRDEDLHLGPRGVRVELVRTPIPQACGEDVHEGGARSDGVGIERFLDNNLDRLLGGVAALFLLQHLEELLLVLLLFLGVLGGAESTGPLLVHLGSGSNAICHGVSI